jgi:hypothetical protein
MLQGFAIDWDRLLNDQGDCLWHGSAVFHSWPS